MVSIELRVSKPSTTMVHGPHVALPELEFVSKTITTSHRRTSMAFTFGGGLAPVLNCSSNQPVLDASRTAGAQIHRSSGIAVHFCSNNSAIHGSIRALGGGATHKSASPQASQQYLGVERMPALSSATR